MQYLQHSLELQNGEGITFKSDIQKGLVDAVKNVLPEAYHRNCVRYIEANWCRRWGEGELKKLLWWDVWPSFSVSEEFENQLENIKQVEEAVGQDLLDRYPPKIWCSAYLDTVCKNQIVENNFTKSFSVWILKARSMSMNEMLEEIRVKMMTRLS